ncbi:MAG: HAMP domain-containing sensor histidine kinase [Hyphomicrobiaceae bacterium]
MRADLVRSTAFRLAAAFAGLFACLVVLLFAAVYLETSREIEKALNARLLDTRDQLVSIARRGGFAELSRVVAAASTIYGEPDVAYLLLDTTGRVIAGNLRSQPTFEGTRLIGISELAAPPSDASPNDGYLSVWATVPGGRLLVGLADEVVHETQEIVMSGLVWGLGATLALSVLAGVFVGWRAQRRVDAIASTLALVSKGDLARRVPLLGNRDDLDKVGAEINGTLDRLKHLFDSLNRQAANIAHDLKKPLGHLRQRLERVRRDRLSAEETGEMLDSSIEEIDAIVETFEALLRITQIEAGAAKSRFRAVDLREMLGDLVETYSVVAEDSGHTLTGDLGPDVPATVSGDRELLVQLFVNLLENAIRHCPPGTPIAVGLGREGADIAVRIADRGAGIPPEEHERVFQPLFRLEQSRTTPGTGLGLSLVKAIAELHGARIDLADNRPGLVVKIRLPPAGEPPRPLARTA